WVAKSSRRSRTGRISSRRIQGCHKGVERLRRRIEKGTEEEIVPAFSKLFSGTRQPSDISKRGISFFPRQGRRSNKPGRQALVLHIWAHATASTGDAEITFRFSST